MSKRVEVLPLTMTTQHARRTKDADGWEHDAWHCTLYYEEDVREQRSMTVTFRMGVGHHAQPPSLDAVLESLLDDASTIQNTRDFEDWCSELGYDWDSRRAERTYRASVAQTNALRVLLGEHYEELLYAERDS